jgi:hypothetical protein
MINHRTLRGIAIVGLLAVLALFTPFRRNSIAASQDDDQQVRTILMTLSRNIVTFERSLPDLVCQEELDQEITSGSGKIEEKRVIKSTLTGRQDKQQTSHGSLYNFEERREIDSINGKKPAAKSELPPPHLSGAFSSILLSHFAVSSLPDFEWKLEPASAKIGDHQCFVLKFSPNENRHKQQYQYGGQTYESRRTGSAYVDNQTMQVVRIEFSEGVLPDNLSEWKSTVEYSPVILDNDKFWLPVSATTQLIEKQGGRRLSATHHYANYRRYTGSIKIDGD